VAHSTSATQPVHHKPRIEPEQVPHGHSIVHPFFMGNSVTVIGPLHFGHTTSTGWPA
jgi:hypothetical protein